MSYTKLAIKGAGLVFAFSLIGALLGYLIRFILARELSVEEFGLFYAVFSFVSFLSLIKTLGFDRALVKFIPEYLAKNDKRSVKGLVLFVILVQLLSNAIVLAAVFLSAKYLSLHFFRSDDAVLVLKLLAIGFFIDSFVVILKYCFQGFKKMYLYSLLDLVRMVLLVSIIILAIYTGRGVMAPTLAYLIVPIILLAIFAAIFMKWVFPSLISLKAKLSKKTLRGVSRYSFFLMVTSSGVLVLQYTDSIMLTFFEGVSAVALYNVALPTSKVLTYFPLAIGAVLLPITSELWTKKKDAMVREGIESLYKYSMIVMLPMALILMSFSALSLSVLFGAQYAAASGALGILSVGTIFIALHQINANFFSGIGKPQIHSTIVFTAVGLNFFGNLLLIPLLGIVGAALTTAVSYAVMALVGIWKMRGFVKIGIPWRIWAKTLLAGFVMILCIIAIKAVLVLNVWLETGIVLIVAGIVYASSLFLLRVLTFDELLQMYRRISGPQLKTPSRPL